MSIRWGQKLFTGKNNDVCFIGIGHGSHLKTF